MAMYMEIQEFSCHFFNTQVEIWSVFERAHSLMRDNIGQVALFIFNTSHWNAFKLYQLNIALHLFELFYC